MNFDLHAEGFFWDARPKPGLCAWMRGGVYQGAEERSLEVAVPFDRHQVKVLMNRTIDRAWRSEVRLGNRAGHDTCCCAIRRGRPIGTSTSAGTPGVQTCERIGSPLRNARQVGTPGWIPDFPMLQNATNPEMICWRAFPGIVRKKTAFSRMGRGKIFIFMAQAY